MAAARFFMDMIRGAAPPLLTPAAPPEAPIYKTVSFFAWTPPAARRSAARVF